MRRCPLVPISLWVCAGIIKTRFLPYDGSLTLRMIDITKEVCGFKEIIYAPITFRRSGSWTSAKLIVGMHKFSDYT